MGMALRSTVWVRTPAGPEFWMELWKRPMGAPRQRTPKAPPGNGMEAGVREQRNIPNWPGGSWLAVSVRSVLEASTVPVRSSRPGSPVEFCMFGEQ